MRLFFILSLVSGSVWAECPNLTGKYAQCLSLTGNTPGSKEVELTQRIEKGVTIYKMSSTTMDGKRIVDEMRSDGDFYTQIQREPVSGTELLITKEYTCTDLGLRVAMSVIFGEQIMMDSILYMRKQDDAMVMVMEGTGANGKPIEESILCQ